jgi:MFS family permease
VLPKHKRTMGVSVQSFVRRVPMALGPVVGGLCIDRWGTEDGVRIAFLAALGMAMVAAVAQQVLIEDERRDQRVGPSTSPSPFAVLREMRPELRNLLVSDVLVRFCEQIPYAFVVVWAMQRIASPVSGTQFGILTSIEMATAMLIYIPVAYLADRSHKKPFVVITFVFFTLFPLALMFCESFPLLAAAFILRGLKEFGEPTRKALIMDLAPEDRKALTFGAYYLMRDTLVSIAAFGGAFLWQISPQANFLAAFACGALGTLWFAVRGRDLKR